MSNVIAFTKVRLPHGWLGNMAPYPIEYEGDMYPTSEALFQALRFGDAASRAMIRAQTSPMAAKMVAKDNAARMTVKQFGDADVDNMRLVLRFKTEQHPQLVTLLLATGDATIIEDVSARSRSASSLFWGAALVDGTWTGRNELGKLWMARRAELLNGAS